MTLSLRWIYAMALREDPAATLGDLREAVTTLESVAMSYKRVMGTSHPQTSRVQKVLNTTRTMSKPAYSYSARIAANRSFPGSSSFNSKSKRAKRLISRHVVILCLGVSAASSRRAVRFTKPTFYTSVD